MIARGAAALLAASCLVAGFGACKDDDERPPPSGDFGSTGPGGGSSGSSNDGGTREGGEGGEAGGDAGDLCNGGVTQQSVEVPSLPISGTPPPPLGGTINDGTYVLSEYNTYGADASTDDGGLGATSSYARATIVFSGGTIRWLAARGPTNALPADTQTGAVYTIAGTNLSTRSLCPTAGTMKDIPYSAVGTSIALFVDAEHREVYERR